MNKRLIRWTSVVSTVFVLLLASAYAFWLVDPVGFRLAIFQPIRELRLFVRELEPVSRFADIETRGLAAPGRVHIPAVAGAIDIVGDLWRPEGAADVAPAMILLHGSAPWGRKAGLIQLLGNDFQQRGWIAFAPDARGFGDTDDPPDIDDPSSWAVTGDLRRIVAFVSNLDGVDPDRIYVFGHSQGADHALEGALTDHRVRAFVLVGPSRYPNGIQVSSRLWNRTRFAADRKLTRPVDNAVMQAATRRSSIVELTNGPLGRPGHAPILLLDGEKEGAGARAYLADAAAGIAPPFAYRSLPESGHYCGVISLFGGNRVFYRPDIYDRLISAVAEHFDAH